MSLKNLHLWTDDEFKELQNNIKSSFLFEDNFPIIAEYNNADGIRTDLDLIKYYSTNKKSPDYGYLDNSFIFDNVVYNVYEYLPNGTPNNFAVIELNNDIFSATVELEPSFILKEFYDLNILETMKQTDAYQNIPEEWNNVMEDFNFYCSEVEDLVKAGGEGYANIYDEEIKESAKNVMSFLMKTKRGINREILNEFFWSKKGTDKDPLKIDGLKCFRLSKKSFDELEEIVQPYMKEYMNHPYFKDFDDVDILSFGVDYPF